MPAPTALHDDARRGALVSLTSAYDALYRLVRNRTTYATGDAEPERPREQTWRYDYLGNMTEWRDQDATGTPRFYDRSLGTITNGIDAVPDGTVRPDALIRAALDADHHLEASHDDSGDMEELTVTAGATLTLSAYAWDAVHRLATATVTTTVTDPDGEVGVPEVVEARFTYDFADLRRVKQAPGDMVQYVSESFEVREDQATKWLHAGGQRLLRVTTAADATTETSFYLSNHLGTTSVVLAADSAPRSASTYLPYGALESEVVSGADPLFDPDYCFTGKERDDATGLDYFGARYYAARLGRWISPDPLGVHEPAQRLDRPIAGHGPYTYSLDDPIRLIDPTGEDPVLATAAAAGGVSAIYSEAVEVHRQMTVEGRSFFQVDERRVVAAGAESFIAVTGSVYSAARGGLPGLVGGGALSTAAGGAARRAILGERTTAAEVLSESAGGATIAMAANVLARAAAPLLGRLEGRLRRALSRRSDAAPAGGGAAAASTPAPGLRTPEEAGISAAAAARIQAVSTRTRQAITVVGSRAAGTAGPRSDWDYILSGQSAARHSAERFLPRGPQGYRKRQRR